MHWHRFLAGLLIAILFLAAGLEWLGLVFIFIAFVALMYGKTKKKAKKTWEEVKKADAFYPEKKFLDTYPKGAGKQIADNLIPAHNTEINYKSWIHKTHTMATNFFKELDELFK